MTTSPEERSQPAEITLEPGKIKPFAAGFDQLTKEGRDNLRSQVGQLIQSHPGNDELTEIGTALGELDEFIEHLKTAKEVKIRLDIGQGKFTFSEEKDEEPVQIEAGETTIESPTVEPFASALGDRVNNPFLIIDGNAQSMQLFDGIDTFPLQQTSQQVLGLVDSFIKSPEKIIINTDPAGRVTLTAIAAPQKT